MARDTTTRAANRGRVRVGQTPRRSGGRYAPLGIVLALVAVAALAAVFVLFPRGRGNQRGTETGLTGKQAPAPDA